MFYLITYGTHQQHVRFLQRGQTLSVALRALLDLVSLVIIMNLWSCWSLKCWQKPWIWWPSCDTLVIPHVTVTTQTIFLYTLTAFRKHLQVCSLRYSLFHTRTAVDWRNWSTLWSRSMLRCWSSKRTWRQRPNTSLAQWSTTALMNFNLSSMQVLKMCS